MPHYEPLPDRSTEPTVSLSLSAVADLQDSLLVAMNDLKRLPRLDHKQRVFSVKAKGKPHSGMAMTMQLRRMKRGNITVHGFRSAFTDWSSECTEYPKEVADKALAHKLPDKPAKQALTKKTRRFN